MKKSELIRQEMAGKWETIAAIKKSVVDEDDREYTEDERKLIESTLDEVKTLEDALLKEQKDEALSARIDEVDGLFQQQPAKPKQKQAPAAPQQRQMAKSYGRQFVESDEWKGFLEKFAPGGHLSGIKGFTSPPVEVKGMLNGYGRKELVTGESDVSAGAFVVPDYTGIYEPIGRYPLTLRQLIDVRQTTSDVVTWVRQTRQPQEAAPVAEANVTDYTGATGEVSGEKPEATNRYVRESADVITIAVWKPATTRALADVAQLRSLIDSELRDDVNEELEDQMLNGDGTGENFTGLANTAGILAQAFNTDIAQTARMAITNLLINGRQMPTAWLLNPQDWEAFDLLQDTNGRYYWGGPVNPGPRTLWGVPVAQSFFLTQGTGYLGNWRKMVLWDREQATIAVSDSHADFFIRNMVAIRCELRAAMGVIRPTGFVEVDLEGGS